MSGEGAGVDVVLAEWGDEDRSDERRPRVEVRVTDPVDETGSDIGDEEAEGEAEQDRQRIEAREAVREAKKERGGQRGRQSHADAVGNCDEASHETRYRGEHPAQNDKVRRKQRVALCRSATIRF